MNAEEREKRRERMLGKGNPMSSSASRKKLSASRKGQPAWNRGLTKENDERVRHHSDVMVGRVHTPEHNENVRQAKLKQWQDPEFVKRWCKAINLKPTKPELELGTYLGDDWLYTGDGQTGTVSVKIPDFTNNDGTKVIEMFGDYWHSEEIVGQGKEEHTNARIEYFKSAGLACLIVWECELKYPEVLRKKIQEFI